MMTLGLKQFPALRKLVILNNPGLEKYNEIFKAQSELLGWESCQFVDRDDLGRIFEVTLKVHPTWDIRFGSRALKLVEDFLESGNAAASIFCIGCLGRGRVFPRTC